MALMIAGDFTLIGRQKMFAADVFRLWLDGRLVGNRAINAMHRRRMRMLQGLPTLRGHNLACWCKPGMPCHADVLLELANQGDASRSGEEPR